MRSWVADAGIAAAVAALELGLLLDDGTASTLAVLATVATGAALVLRRRVPLVVLGLALAAAVTVVAVGETPSGASVLVALGTVAATCGRRASVAALVVTAVAVTGLSILTSGRDGRVQAAVVGALAAGPFAAGAWSIGAYVRAQRRYRDGLEARTRLLEREREQLAQIAVHEERAAIARELHDIVAHSVGMMLLGVRGAREVLRDAPDAADDTLAQVEQGGERSVAELQRILTLLRDPGASAARHPQPSLDALPRLLDEHRATGLAVALQRDGEPVPLPDGIGVSAYRIVQEALTNTRRHAAAAHVAVRLAYRPHELEVSVEDDGAPSVAAGGGHGLVGMRERVALLGGRLEAGPAPGGGFRVVATLPTDGATS
jgi:signal transduction histidine kinase